MKGQWFIVEQDVTSLVIIIYKYNPNSAAYFQDLSKPSSYLVYHVGLATFDKFNAAGKNCDIEISWISWYPGNMLQSFDNICKY